MQYLLIFHLLEPSILFSLWNDTLRDILRVKIWKTLWKPLHLVVDKSHYNEHFWQNHCFHQDSLRLEYDSACPRKEMPFFFFAEWSFLRALWGQLKSQCIHWKDSGFFKASDMQQGSMKSRCYVMNISIVSTEASQHWKEFKICVRLNSKITPYFKLIWIL